MDTKRLALTAIFGVAALAFLFMPPKTADEQVLASGKTNNGKYRIEADGSVLAAATGLNNSPAPTPAPKPTPSPTPTKPDRRPFLPWRSEEPEAQVEPVPDEVSKEAVEPQVPAPVQQMNCKDGKCYPATTIYRRGLFRR